MHIEMFPYHIIHAECIGRYVAMVDDAVYDELMAYRATLPKTRFGDAYNPEHVENMQRLTRRW